METLFALPALCEGNPQITGGYPLEVSDGKLSFLWSTPEQTVQ